MFSLPCPSLAPQYKLSLSVVRYPQNLARNTAKHGCPTLYTIVPDTDMIPIPGMAERLDTFLAKQQQQGGLGLAGLPGTTERYFSGQSVRSVPTSSRCTRSSPPLAETWCQSTRRSCSTWWRDITPGGSTRPSTFSTSSALTWTGKHEAQLRAHQFSHKLLQVGISAGQTWNRDWFWGWKLHF